MRRLHLFEFEDQQWLPRSIRDGVTDFLQFAVVRTGLYDRLSLRLLDAMQRSGAVNVVDLCSGAGGPWQRLAASLLTSQSQTGPDQVTLTDYFPNIPTLEALVEAAPLSNLRFCDKSVSALEVPEHLEGFRTLFSSFHHFRPEQAQLILADAVRQNQGISIAESTQRHPLLLAYMLLTPVLVLLTSPFQKPFRWSRLFWTYVIPAVPLVVIFDGIVSCLRTYTPDELMEMVRGVPGHESFEWDAGIECIGRLPVGVTYLIGVPRRAVAVRD